MRIITLVLMAATLFGRSRIAVSVSPSQITLGASQSQQFTALVSGTSNQTVAWSLHPAIGTISSTGFYSAPAIVSVPTALTVRATSQANPTKLISGSATVNLIANPPPPPPLLNQIITFGLLPNHTLGDPAFTISATASSGLPVSFVSLTAPCAVSGSTVTLVTTGTCTVEATQAGNTVYAPAKPVDQSFQIAGSPPPPPPPPSGDPIGFGNSQFYLFEEVYGADAYTDPAIPLDISQSMSNATALHDPADPGFVNFALGQNAGTLQMFGASIVQGQSSSYIEAQRAAYSNVCSAKGPVASGWEAMAEWDQAGGSWVPNGRPRYLGQTRQQAYGTITGYYLGLAPLNTYLAQPRASRQCNLRAVSDFPANIAYSYEMGADLSLEERGIDELSDISTGVAFARGAARQYDRRWGIDISSWRTSANSATSFDSNGTLIGGWSPSYLRRHMYIARMSGAHIVKMEAAVYRYSDTGPLNPFGQALQEFGTFALVRHPDVGKPVAKVALMMDFYHGFDPKHWLYTQYDAVWYGDIPYSDGDRMRQKLTSHTQFCGRLAGWVTFSAKRWRQSTGRIPHCIDLSRSTTLAFSRLLILRWAPYSRLSATTRLMSSLVWWELC